MNENNESSKVKEEPIPSGQVPSEPVSVEPVQPVQENAQPDKVKSVGEDDEDANYDFLLGEQGDIGNGEKKEKPDVSKIPSAKAAPTSPSAPASLPQSAPTPQAQAPAEVKLDKGTLEEIKKVVAPAPLPKEDKPYTIDDLYKETQRPLVTDKIVSALDAASPAEKAVLLQTLLDQTAKHAFLLAQLNNKQIEANFNKRLEEIKQSVTPVITKQQETEMKSLEDSFFTKNPDLKQHYRVVNLAAQELKNSPEAMQIKDINVGMNLVAARTREILAASGINFPTANPNAPAEGERQGQGSVPRPMRTLDGGRSQGQTVTKPNEDYSWMNDR